MQPAKARESAWPKPLYQKLKHFHQSLQDKCDNKTENIQLVDMETSLPQPRMAPDAQPAERVPCTYPTFDSLRPQQIFAYMGSFGTEMESKVQPHQSSSSAAGSALSAKRVNSDPPFGKNKRSVADVSQQSRAIGSQKAPTSFNVPKQGRINTGLGLSAPTAAASRHNPERFPPSSQLGEARKIPPRGAFEAAVGSREPPEWSSGSVYTKSPEIDAPPLSGANAVPLSKIVLNPVMKRIQQQKRELDQELEKKELEKKELEKKERALEMEQQRQKQEQQKKATEIEEQQRQKEQQKREEIQQQQQRQRQSAPEPAKPLNKALDGNTDNIAVKDKASGTFAAVAASPPPLTQPPLTQDSTRSVEPAAQTPASITLEPATSSTPASKPLTILSEPAQQKQKQKQQNDEQKHPPTAPASTTTNDSKGKDKLSPQEQEHMDAVTAVMAAAAAATDVDTNVDTGAQAQPGGKASSASIETQDIDDSIEFTGNITTLLLVSGLAFGQNSGFVDNFATVSGASLDEAIKLAQSIIHGSSVSEQNP